MNGAFYHVALCFFLGLPVVLLAIRLFGSRLMPWWAFILMVAILGWGLANAMVYFHYAHLEDIIDGHGDDPPQRLLDAWSSDGAKRVFALFFGWLYGLVYSVPFVCIYAIIAHSRRMSASLRLAPTTK